MTRDESRKIIINERQLAAAFNEWQRQYLIDPQEFDRSEALDYGARCAAHHDGRIILAHKPNGEFIYLDERGCTIYERRALFLSCHIRACELHPDRGGSDQAMTALNAAMAQAALRTKASMNQFDHLRHASRAYP